MEKTIVQKIIVAGIIIDQQQVLIVQRGADEEAFPNLWEIPSGKREFFESSLEALKREVQEETGLMVKPIVPVAVFEFKVEKPNEVRDATQICFLVKLTGSREVTLSSEHQNYAWVEENDLDNYSLSKETKGAIKQAFYYVTRN